VTHGRHSWTVADPCAAGVAGEVKPRTVRELIDAPALWASYADVLVGFELATDAADLARQAEPYLDFAPVELPEFLARKDFAGLGAQARAAVEDLLPG